MTQFAKNYMKKLHETTQQEILRMQHAAKRNIG